jgi:hypothetical protein
MSRSIELIKQAMEDSKNPTPNEAKTKERREEEALSTGGEESNVRDGITALDAYLSSTGDTKRHNKAIISQLFENGQPGKYVARERTLVEKVAHVLGRK